MADWNVVDSRPAPLSAETQMRLIGRYGDDLEKLERLTGLDTAAWRQTPTRQSSHPKPGDKPKSKLQGSGPYRLR